MSRNSGKVDPDLLAEKHKDEYVVYYDVIVDQDEPIEDVFCVRKIKTAEDLMTLPMDSYVKIAAEQGNMTHQSLDSAISDYKNKISECENMNELPSFRPINLSDDEKKQVISSIKADMDIDLHEYNDGRVSQADIVQTKFDKSAYTFDSAALEERLSRINDLASNEPVIAFDNVPF